MSKTHVKVTPHGFDLPVTHLTQAPPLGGL